MQAYSMDLRERVLADSDLGMKASSVAQKYRVSTRWVQKLLKRRSETGRIEPLQGRTGPKPKWTQHLQSIQALVKDHPDATLEEYSALLKKKLGLSISYVTVWRIFKRLNITFKKSTSCR